MSCHWVTIDGKGNDKNRKNALPGHIVSINDRFREGQTCVQKHQAKKQDKADKKARFMLYYDLNLSEAKNREKLLQYGLNLSDGTIRNRSKGMRHTHLVNVPITQEQYSSWEGEPS